MLHTNEGQQSSQDRHFGLVGVDTADEVARLDCQLGPNRQGADSEQPRRIARVRSRQGDVGEGTLCCFCKWKVAGKIQSKQQQSNRRRASQREFTFNLDEVVVARGVEEVDVLDDFDAIGRTHDMEIVFSICATWSWDEDIRLAGVRLPEEDAAMGLRGEDIDRHIIELLRGASGGA